MAVNTGKLSGAKAKTGQTLAKLWRPFAYAPLLGWLIGILLAVFLEQLVGQPLARMLGLGKVPVLFGLLIVLKTPLLVPGAFLYAVLIYLLPIGIVVKLIENPANKAAAWLLRYPMWISVIVHLILLYIALHFWADINAYRGLVVRLTMIAIIITTSLNVINGYMGEFSCSHPGFMALGAYAASVFSVILFVDDKTFGAALLPAWMGPFMFPLGLIFGGVVAALGAIIIAIPSFKTRGDYLAIISLAFMFIVKSLIENLEFVGGPRGLAGQPDWATLPVVFAWTILAVWVINNFVLSTLGKALNAVRDDEIAADAMTVNTRRTKMTAFLFSAFWAGVGGGLLAHVLRYVNPGSFSLQKLAEVLAMVYFGGLNSVVGSIVGAVGFSVLSEALRPLELYKWIIIPVMLILVMIYRPTGLVAFTELNVHDLIKPKQK